MIIRQTTTIVFEYPQDYVQEQEWCKTKEDRWIHKGTDTLGAVYENTISYSIGQPNSSEIPNNCEPQTIRCPKCGRTDYIRDMEKDMGVKDSHYKYKCINCNTYIKDEPTISKMEQIDKDINVRSKDEPQTDDDKKHCVFCKWVYEPNVCGRCRNMNLFADAIEDEPQTDCAWK